MDERVNEKYSLPLKDTFDYINKKTNKAIRKPWSIVEREKWILRCGTCPICDESWSGTNPITKEHIHPIVLGGPERCDNIVPLCDKCNTARNAVMHAVLGTAKIVAIRRRMPLIENAVRHFIIWSHASIYFDREALSYCQDLSEEFAKQREISNPYTIIKTENLTDDGNSLFGKIKHFLNFKSETHTSPEMPNNAYATKHKNIVSEKENENKIVSKEISKIQEQKENTDKNPKNIGVNKEKFKQEIKQLLADDDEISVMVIGNRIRKMQEQNKWNELGTRSFLRHHGFTGNFGLLNALKLCFGGEIEVEENKNAQRIKILREKTNEDDLISNDITLFLKEEFSKRLLTKTFQDGVTASQIAYVVKLAKDNFKLSWTELFKPFNVKGTVQQKSVSLVTLLGFIIEEEKNEDGKIIYKISESTN
tara:strand:+ start:283 stop:1548 length:1266 start_codon:yes stop_codon:yes gene_type:complete